MFEQPLSRGDKRSGSPLELSEVQMDRLIELTAAKEFILDSAPEDWEQLIDTELLQEYRLSLMQWDDKKILSFCSNHDLWEDPTFAKALVDVISGKTLPAITS